MTELILCEYLPVEILLIIWEDYMTDRDKLFVTKENYEKNHKHIFDYYPKLRTKQGFFNYCHFLAKNNCYHIIGLLFQDENNFSLFYDPKKEIRFYYNHSVYWSYLTYMTAVATNSKANETCSILKSTIKNITQDIKSKEKESNNKISNREKKNFKTKKYLREWAN